jgi:hypothetical protein
MSTIYEGWSGPGPQNNSDRVEWSKWEKKFAYLPTRLPTGLIWGKTYYSRNMIAMEWVRGSESTPGPKTVQTGTIFDVLNTEE